jgi:hypothetical protein
MDYSSSYCNMATYSLYTIMAVKTYIYIVVLSVEYYSTLKCYTEQNPVSFSIRVSVLFSILWS